MTRLLITAITLVSLGCAEVDAPSAASEGPSPAASAAPQAPSSAASAAGGAAAAKLPTISFDRAFPRLTFDRPVFVTQGPAGSPLAERMFVVEQIGRIRVFEKRADVDATKVFLDVRSIVRMKHNEEGLLSLVFHPKYAENGEFFIYYSASNPKRNIIARYRVSKDDPEKADPNSGEVLLEVEQPYGNHNGSTLLFGPDGYLYASFGDGGLANDPHRAGQNLGTLLAKIIRIDVDKPPDAGLPYAIPADNPFVNRADARPEIWAYGLRNVWRMSFDRETGDLWAGDVGQNKWEEIDLITKGGNYGWNIREGAHAFERGTSSDPLIDPVAEYGRDDGISVTGGYVYRGKQYPQLAGVYVYADYVSGRVWGLRYENGKVTANAQMRAEREPLYVTSFGEDAEGEMYICTFDQLDGDKGRVHKLVARGSAAR